MPEIILRTITKIDDALIEAATWVTFTFAGMKYGPSHLELLKKKRAEKHAVH